MTTLTELEALADAAAVIDHNECAEWYGTTDLLERGGVAYLKNARFISACDPSTIKQLIALCRTQNRALQNFDKHTSGVLIPQTRCQGSEAIAAYEQLNSGEIK